MGCVFLYVHVNIYLCVDCKKSNLIFFLTYAIAVAFCFFVIVDRAKHTLVMSFGYFSTLFLKIKSISLPAGNAWIINKPRFRKFSMEKQTSNFSLIFSNSPQMFFTLQRLSWKELILSDASSMQNKLYLNI